MPKFESVDRALLVGLGVCLLFGCVFRERRDLVEANEAYDRCVQEYSVEQPECVTLDAKRRQLQRQYEESAQRAWGCNAATDGCPPNR
jgi:hypothetical protein